MLHATNRACVNRESCVLRVKSIAKPHQHAVHMHTVYTYTVQCIIRLTYPRKFCDVQRASFTVRESCIACSAYCAEKELVEKLHNLGFVL